MMVGRVRVHAHHRRTQLPVRAGKIFPDQRAHLCDLARRHRPIERVRTGCLAPMMDGHLHTFPQVGNAVEVSARLVFPDVDRTEERLKRHSALWLEPELYLAFDSEGKVQTGQQRTYPTARAQQELPGLVFTLCREYADAARVRCPTRHRLVETQDRAMFAGQTQMRFDASFRSN